MDFPKLKIYQGGYDGFGHQFEGTLRLLSLAINKKAIYFYDYKKTFRFEHNPRDSDILINYISEGLKYLKKVDTSYRSLSTYRISNGDNRSFEYILARDVNYANTIYLYDGVGSGQCLPPNFEHIDEMGKSLPLLRCAFVTHNSFLPPPTYDNKYLNVCCHIRLGDAVGSRQLDTENIFNVIRHFQKQNKKYRVIIHSDEDVSYLQFDNTIIYNKSTDVINVFSDFIHADIFVMNYSSISIAAHLLGDPKQVVICPDKAGVTFKQRIFGKCITCSEILSTAI